MKTFKEYLEEISKKTYASAIGKAGDAGKYGTVHKLVSRAGREKGEKFGKDMDQVAYGKKKHERSMDKRTNNDPLKSRKVGVTKQGKANKRDVENLKGKLKDNIVGMRRARVYDVREGFGGNEADNYAKEQ